MVKHSALDQLPPAEFKQELGVPLGHQAKIKRIIAANRLAVDPNSLAQYDPCSIYGDKEATLTTDINVIRLASVDETNSAFRHVSSLLPSRQQYGATPPPYNCPITP